MWTLYNTKTGLLKNDLTQAEAEDAIQFYHLFFNRRGIWQNMRGDIYLWVNR